MSAADQDYIAKLEEKLAKQAIWVEQLERGLYPSDHIIKDLAAVYNEHHRAIAKLCDSHLDKSGKLLGEVRNRARTIMRTKK